MLYKKETIYFILALLFLAISASLIFLAINKANNFFNSFSLSASLISFDILIKKEATLMFVGDIMLDRGVEAMIKKHGNGDWSFPFLKSAEFLKKADILFGNLESQISDKGRNVGTIYSFRADPKTMEGLIFAGFDVVSVANNHIYDYSEKAMEDSFSRLEKAGIDYAGGGFSEKEAHKPVIEEIDGLKIAFLAYNDIGSKYWEAKKDKSGIAWLDGKIVEDIKEAKGLSDFLVVSLHFGDEYETEENSRQEYFAHLAIDSGADAVIGHHPHVVQPVERYNGGVIAYSLGNFVFDQYFSEETMKGRLLELRLVNAKIDKIIEREVKINDFYQPEIAL